VKGIGPKRALRALVHPVGQIATAIESKNTRYLYELPEVGKRTAETIIAELSGKLTAFALQGAAAEAPLPAARSPLEQDALDAAVALGISRAEAERLLERAKQADAKLKSAESLLRGMLRVRSTRV